MFYSKKKKQTKKTSFFFQTDNNVHVYTKYTYTGGIIYQYMYIYNQHKLRIISNIGYAFNK